MPERNRPGRGGGGTSNFVKRDEIKHAYNLSLEFFFSGRVPVLRRLFSTLSLQVWPLLKVKGGDKG
jgi:hypothetical protein